jgi:hypothetical protein
MIGRYGFDLCIGETTFHNSQKTFDFTGLVGSRLSQPCSTHFSKLILVSQQEYLLAFEHGVQEMIPAPMTTQ